MMKKRVKDVMRNADIAWQKGDEEGLLSLSDVVTFQDVLLFASSMKREPPQREPPRRRMGCNMAYEDDPLYLNFRSANAGASAISDVIPDAGTRASVGEYAEPRVMLKVWPSNTWQLLKKHLRTRLGLKAVPDANIRFLYKGIEMRNEKMVADYNFDIQCDSSTIPRDGTSAERAADIDYLIIGRHKKGIGIEGIGLFVAPEVPVETRFHRKVQEALASLRSGIQPRLTDDGVGATYFIRSSDKRSIIGVLQPKDEEAFAPQNPSGFVGKENSQGLRAGVFSTQQAAREVAAYLLDHEKNAGVPHTTLVHVRHPKLVAAKGEVVWKVAAFQEFVETQGTAGHFSSSVFSTSSVQKIGILDVRILNLGRNNGSLLVKLRRKDNVAKYELVPTDHGLSLPDRLEIGDEDIAWMSWPQAQQPFAAEELKYISRLNPALDDKTLEHSLGIRRECRRLCESTTMVLQLFAKENLTLYDIGRFIYRMDSGDGTGEQKSDFEKMVIDATDEMLMTTMDENQQAVKSVNLLNLDLDVQGVQTLKSRVDEENKLAFPENQTAAGSSSGMGTPGQNHGASLKGSTIARSTVEEGRGDERHIFWREKAPVVWSPEQEDCYRERLQAKIEAYLGLKKAKAEQDSAAATATAASSFVDVLELHEHSLQQERRECEAAVPASAAVASLSDASEEAAQQSHARAQAPLEEAQVPHGEEAEQAQDQATADAERIRRLEGELAGARKAVQRLSSELEALRKQRAEELAEIRQRLQDKDIEIQDFLADLSVDTEEAETWPVLYPGPGGGNGLKFHSDFEICD
eukprot:TRINITY_DN15055_c0_g1_i1.p1 TRINITY_DN15055_c0_g1~~TRINITY_DN15055_c0_g1_i1.p1  ORF type:complete len:922 (-),score=179.66 TRINITY_DN15055_c0_g1_i1:40-2451(-)